MKKPFHLAIKKTNQKIYEHLGERRNTKITEMWKKKNEIYMVELMAISITYLSIYNTWIYNI